MPHVEESWMCFYFILQINAPTLCRYASLVCHWRRWCHLSAGLVTGQGVYCHSKVSYLKCHSQKHKWQDAAPCTCSGDKKWFGPRHIIIITDPGRQFHPQWGYHYIFNKTVFLYLKLLLSIFSSFVYVLKQFKSELLSGMYHLSLIQYINTNVIPEWVVWQRKDSFLFHLDECSVEKHLAQCALPSFPASLPGGRTPELLPIENGVMPL